VTRMASGWRNHIQRGNGHCARGHTTVHHPGPQENTERMSGVLGPRGKYANYLGAA
jgi:hypothetical protein